MFDTNYIDNYKEYLTHERRASANTVSSYIRDITQFANHQWNGENGDFEHVTDDDIRYYITILQDNGRSSSTVSRCIASLRAFFRHMMDDGFNGPNPVAGIASINAPKKTPHILSNEEIENILKAEGTLEEKANKLFTEALNNGGKDNITIVIVHVN